MDTSKKYIEMCEKAEEIQTLWKPRVGDWFYKRDGIGFGLWLICKIEEDVLFCSGERMNQPSFNHQFVEFRVPEEYIWLPRQDQLQEMVIEKTNPLDDRRLEKDVAINRLIGNFWNKVNMNWNKNKYFWQFNSMEQLWVAFVMKEKYNKIWIKGEWRKR